MTSKAEIQKIVKSMNVKIFALEAKLHTKSLEVDRLLSKKMGASLTLDESNKMHKKIMKAYEYREKLAQEIEIWRTEKKTTLNNWRLQQLL